MLSIKKEDFDKIIQCLSDENFQKSGTQSYDDLYANYIDKLSYLSGLMRINYNELFKDKNFSDKEKREFIIEVKILNRWLYEFKKSNYEEEILNENVLPSLEYVLKNVGNVDKDKIFQKIQNLNKHKNDGRLLQSNNFIDKNERKNNLVIPVYKSRKKISIFYFLFSFSIFNVVFILVCELILRLQSLGFL